MHPTSAPGARFDDLVTGSAVAFGPPRDVLCARHRDEVAGVLDEVDRVTRNGSWAFGFVAYEAAGGLDPTLMTHDPVEGLPLAWFGVVDGPDRVPVLPRSGPEPGALSWTPEWDPPAHARAVRQVRRHIAAGQTYQCNLTMPMHAAAPPAFDALALHRGLVHGQRGAYNAYLDLGRFAVASASPELFFEQRGDRILMRPMKGTAPRGRTTAEDDAAVARLRSCAKERAENVMIVDLVRNDLGRIAVPGTVAVPRLLHAERYETVHQLTSDVTARLRPDVGLSDVFRALFPCGSVTGAPKARTMELIRALEPGPRGVYCGAIGVVGPPGAKVRARFSVAIRTVLADRATGRLTYGVGSGITWSSRAAAEHAEIEAKARVLAVRREDFELLETMYCTPRGELRNLDAHLARMADSARYFGFPFDAGAARAQLDHRRDVGEARVRLRCGHDGALAVDVAAAPAPLRRPARLAVDPEPMDTTRCWSRHKTSRRAPYETRLGRHPGADDVVVVNERGQVAETCTANLAVRLDGRWWTPPLDSGCLPGVERARLVDAGHLHERTLTPDDLAGADGLALVNSLRGWRPAQLLGVPTAVPADLIPTGNPA